MGFAEFVLHLSRMNPDMMYLHQDCGYLNISYFKFDIDDQTGEYSKTCLKQPLSKRPEIGFQDQISLNAGQKYCRMLQREHSAILSSFIKLPFVIKTFVLSIFEWPLKTGFTVQFSFDPFFSNRIETIW